MILRMRLAALGLAVATLTVASVWSARGLPATHASHLLLYLGAGAAWLGAALLAPRLAPGRRDTLIILTLALVMRVPAWLGPPAHSDDLYRYVWDGRVQRAGINPYLYTPQAPEVEHLRDANWARVNNQHLPTIYPPLAQLLFRAAPGPVGWKLIAALADLALVVLLLWWKPRQAVVWAWCPLAVLELALDAHVDAVAILLMMAALATPRKGWAGALLGASAAVKLLGLALLPGLRSKRAVAAFVVVVGLTAVPFVAAGPRMVGSLGEYGRRWRGNDGAFALLYGASEQLIAHSQYRGRVERAGSSWLRFVTGRDRDTVFPDEMANFVARAVTALLLLLVATVAFVRKAPPLKFAELVLGAFVLLTPTLHPWYVLWMVPLVAAGGSPAWLLLAALAPLGYEPLGRWLTTGVWQDRVWTRALEHGLTWGVLLVGLIPAKRPLLSSDR
jgi:hypothetical protein